MTHTTLPLKWLLTLLLLGSVTWLHAQSAYEYIEEGQYYAVVRGRTELDKKKSRERWSWGDIYHTGHYDAYEYDPDTEKIYYKEALE